MPRGQDAPAHERGAVHACAASSHGRSRDHARSRDHMGGTCLWDGWDVTRACRHRPMPSRVPRAVVSECMHARHHGEDMGESGPRVRGRFMEGSRTWASPARGARAREGRASRGESAPRSGAPSSPRSAASSAAELEAPRGARRCEASSGRRARVGWSEAARTHPSLAVRRAGTRRRRPGKLGTK